jgi:RNA 3'-terminal phosphate cyclase (ATP)
MGDLIQIDGSYGEGGGQVLRTSLSLSAITGKPVEIVNIRGGRAKPGLQAQHLAAVRAAGAICGATIKGDASGSMYLLFEPLHEPRADDYFFEIGTAGATTLVAQTVIVPLSLALSQSTVTVRGGTHNPMAPTADYLEHVYCPALREAGYDVSCSCGPPGFYPRGGGELRVAIGLASNRKPIVIESRVNSAPVAHVITSNLSDSVADRAEAVLLSRFPGSVAKRLESGVSTGAAVTIICGHAGFSALGERGKPMEKVANEAADQFLEWLGGEAPLDEHLADQLVLPALFAGGASRWRTQRVTEHLRTVLWVARQFCPVECDVDEDSGVVALRPFSS